MTPLQERLPALAPADSPRRRSARVLRPARTPAGVSVALALTAALGLTAAEVVSGMLGRPLGWVPINEAVAMGGTHTWADLQLVAIGLAAAGTVFVLLAVLPGRARLVALETSDPLIVIGITRSGLRRTLRAVAQQVEGVGRARVRLRRGTIEVVVLTRAEAPGSMLRQVGSAVGDRLTALGALGGGEVVVRLRRRGL
ncbi:DUF6286 domain-containing protein [Nonomuraea sp. NPDC050310]|uniref:DUF6286 domain-containing protein n=1 Tax=unclassified Nonomuraea TaxID=2593643 RepID=UPI0033C8C0AC